MILHLAEQWRNLSDTPRESGLGWTLQYYDTRPPEQSAWNVDGELLVLNPREILGTTGVALHPSFRKEPDQDKLTKVREAYERDVTRSADVKRQRLPGQTPQPVRAKVKAGMSGKDVQTRPGTKPAVERRPYPFGPVAQEHRVAAKQAQGLQEVSSDEDTRPLVPLQNQPGTGGAEKQQTHPVGAEEMGAASKTDDAAPQQDDQPQREDFQSDRGGCCCRTEEPAA
eukprot:6479889-Amphidinium_carterae.2